MPSDRFTDHILGHASGLSLAFGNDFSNNQAIDMRTLFFCASLLVAAACSGKEENAGHGSGGSSANSGGASANGGSNATDGGMSAAAGSAGNSASGGSTTSGGAAPTAGEGGQGTAGGELVDCDLRKVVCKVVQPACPENQVPSVNGLCFGPCVPIESCACSAAAECPFSDRYTCWQQTHCGPFVR